MNPEQIEQNKISIEDSEYIKYEGKQITIKTDWLNCYFDHRYRTLRVPVDKKAELYKLLHHIDKLVAKKLPTKMKQTKLIKEWRQETFEINSMPIDCYELRPKYEYANLYNENKEEIPINNIECPASECRFVFTIPPIKSFNGYFGTNLKCIQILQRKKQAKKYEAKKYDFMFD